MNKNRIIQKSKNNVDNRLSHEIQHGTYLSKHGAADIWNWKTPAGKIRYARRISMLSQHISHSMTILELGCGAGYFTQSISAKSSNITSIDISIDLLRDAIKACNQKLVNFVRANAYEMPFSNNSFDTIVGSSVLHHLDIDKAIIEMHRVLKVNGTIVFTEPNMLNPQIMIQKNVSFIKRLSGDSPDETAFFKWSLEKKLRNAGFKNIVIQPFDFLHPQLPSNVLPYVMSICKLLENIPLLREISGSLYIVAKK